MQHPPANRYTVPNEKVGLTSPNMDEMNIPPALFKFLYEKKQAPVPTATVGKTDSMRKRILQLSLFPDIYDKRGKSRSPGNVDFGESHKIKGNPY